MNNQEIREKLFELADDKYKEFHSGLCPNTNNIIGVRVPILRNFAKELIKQVEYKEYLENALDDYYEEVMLQGMVIGHIKIGIEEKLEYIAKFVPKIDNWAVCDVCCAGFKDAKKYPKEVWNFLQPYLHSNQEFRIRFGVVMLLSYYMTEEYIDRVLNEMNTILKEEYYVKMAVAWLVSVAYIKFPEKTMPFLEECNLDNFTYNKALQKITESYQVTQQEKEKIKSMKRK